MSGCKETTTGSVKSVVISPDCFLRSRRLMTNTVRSVIQKVSKKMELVSVAINRAAVKLN